MKLHEYQQRAVDFMVKHPYCILSVGMGLGKTAAVLHCLDRLRPHSCLIVAPKRVAETVWKQEAEKWDLWTVAESMEIVKGTAKQRREALCDGRYPYKVIGRDNLGDLFKEKDDKKPLLHFEMVVLDELTSFKSIESKRTRRVFALAREAARCIGLTGTFLANGAIDIFGQCAAVGLAANLKEFYSWRARYFKDVMAGSGMAWHKWRLTVPLDEVLRQVKSDIFTLDSRDYLDIPTVSVVAHPVALYPDERERYDNLEAFLDCNIEGVGMSVKEDAKFMKLQTMCDGFVYTGDTFEEEGFYDHVIRGERSAKLEAVADFCERCLAEAEPVLLFYAFRAERDWLREMLKDRGVATMEVRERGAIDRWNAGDFDGVLMAHPASAGHGLNLQSGGRIVVWSTLTYNYEYYAQANARLARQGQRLAVQIHVFTAEHTVEDGKQKALERKDKEQGQFLELTKTKIMDALLEQSYNIYKNA